MKRPTIERLRRRLDLPSMLYRDQRWRRHRSKLNSKSKFVYCKPLGGLNDSLCQINKCLVYCLMSKRILVINAVNSGQLQRLEDYFQVHPSARDSIVITDSIKTLTSSSSLFPGDLSEDVDELIPVFDLQTTIHVDRVTRVPTQFDLYEYEYPHDVLFHSQCGGGAGWSALERFRLTESALAAVEQRLRDLPKRYHALHIRDSDYSADLEAFLERVFPILNRDRLPCLICTDNPNTAARVKRELAGIETLSIFRFPPGIEPGQSLHYSPHARGWDYDIGMIADLIAMARSRQLMICPLKQGGLSGFGLLARDLQSRPHVLSRLTRKQSNQP